MNVIVTDKGFGADDWNGAIVPLGQLSPQDRGPGLAVDLGPDADPEDLTPWLDRIGLIRVEFLKFSDGRGFTIAARLRRLGYRGRLRARGHILADQYAMIRRSGFDEVEIPDDLAARQPQEQWLARADWKAHHYRARLRG